MHYACFPLFIREFFVQWIGQVYVKGVSARFREDVGMGGGLVPVLVAIRFIREM